MSEKQTRTTKPRLREREPDTIIPPRPAPPKKVEFEDGVGFATGVEADGYTVKSPGDRVELWSPSPPAQIFAAYCSAVKIAGKPAPGVAVKVLLTKQTLLIPTAHLEAGFVQLLKASAKASPGERLTFDLTRVTELRDPRQMREGRQRKEQLGRTPQSISADEAVEMLDGLKAQLDRLQAPVQQELELYLHQLPSIRFDSVEEKQRLEESMGVLLSRLGQRVVRYDVEKKAPVDEEPSLLRCVTIGDGYFRLEHFRDGKKHRTGIGPNLPPLTLVPTPPDSRRRSK